MYYGIYENVHQKTLGLFVFSDLGSKKVIEFFIKSGNIKSIFKNDHFMKKRKHQRSNPKNLFNSF